MERLKIYAACAVFLFLTAVKLLFPDTAAELRTQVHSIIDHNDDYTEMVQTLGRSLAESSWGNKLVAALGMNRREAEQEQEAVPNMRWKGDKKQNVGAIHESPACRSTEIIFPHHTLQPTQGHLKCNICLTANVK